LGFKLDMMMHPIQFMIINLCSRVVNWITIIFYQYIP